MFSKILSPRKHRPRYKLDSLDVLQGRLERYMREASEGKAKSLLSNQGAPMQQYVGFFREELLMIDGKVRYTNVKIKCSRVLERHILLFILLP